ncbi:hypothetical protein AX766_11550 [Flavobacterium covae]|uniref:GHMP kinase N-terminal domain-containing protein n=2 Tax=Flavobacterium TaxID=237 RepID=A0AA94EYV4_9FLAO|nr:MULTISPECIES: hypothetical protein [Flavobacterium]OXA83111.1 hypothetical protein B0A56_02525 [Flavobacterium columnare NBRC 100251 = ATCC 23463]AND64971.1 hypothetical protein AX766_11550 [Flavobacterium covae]MCH4830863.1 hypothetical protein [Flavobacterium columnare]MCH4833197.1 hypothetical protein [Flavobacterium columnare]MCJ1807184.1 hypothetical protein [Flavobacterium covae]
MIIKITTYAKVGELLQGAFGKNQPFLVSNKSSKLFKTDTIASINPIDEETRLDIKSNKAKELFHSLIEEKGITPINKIYFNQKRNFKVGKGLSSSSTDILGILLTLNKLYKTQYSNHFLYKIASQIDPTDPCLDFNSLLFNQKSGKILENLNPISYSILYFDSDPNVDIDTIKISKAREYSESQMIEFKNLYSILKVSVKNNDYRTFFECVTKSAVINETILPKKKFTLLYDFAIENNCGLFVAHSGTFMGLLIEPYRLKSIDFKVRCLVEKHWKTTLYIE